MPSTALGITNQPEIEKRDALAAGTGDGIYRGEGSEMAVVAQGPVTSSVNVGTGRGAVSGHWAAIATATTAGPFDDPAGGAPGDLRRKDLVYWLLPTGVTVETGVEDASPDIPDTPANAIALAEIHCRKGMTSVKDDDDASNGFIVEARDFL